MEEQYVKRLGYTQKAYRQLVIVCAFVMMAAIFVAVVYQVILGVSLALFCAGIFIYFSSEEIHKQLGLSYTHECGVIHIRKAVARYGDTLFIPSRFFWADVTHISDGAFDSDKNAELRRVYLPKSITSLGKDIFGAHAVRIEIYYEGSEQDFRLIEGVESLVFGAISFGCAQPALTPKQKKSGKKACADNTEDSEK